MSRYNKLWVSLVGTLAIFLLEYGVPSQASVSLVSLVTAFGVYLTPNRVDSVGNPS